MNEKTPERGSVIVDNLKQVDRSGARSPSVAAPAGAVNRCCSRPTAEAPRAPQRVPRVTTGLNLAPPEPAGGEGEGRVSPVTLPDLPIPVLLTSATAADRALFARRLHDLGARRCGPFVAGCCRVHSPEEIDVALFGDDTWSGSVAGMPDGGAVVAATGGTLYIDEISRLSLRTQAKLLHALERRCHPGVVTDVEIPLDFRLIAATTANLHEEVHRGRFRASLLFAIWGFSLWVPPLAPRGEADDGPNAGSPAAAIELRRWLQAQPV